MRKTFRKKIRNTVAAAAGVFLSFTLAASAAESGTKKICLDPGHQGSWVDMSEKEPNAPFSDVMKTKATTGTSSNFGGRPEYEVNLEIAKLVRYELWERGYEVILTREDNDTAISNKERAILATQEDCDVIVRIHCNSDYSESVGGALVMVPSKENLYVGGLSEESYRLGESILKEYCAVTGLANDGVVYADDMTGINWSSMPVTILEMGFMSNAGDDAYLQEESHWSKMAKAVADGIDHYFKAQNQE